MTAYLKLYLEKAQVSLATMFDYVAWDLKCDIDEFAGLFVASGYADRFGHGDVSVVCGISGPELAEAVIRKTGSAINLVEPRFAANRSPEYWAGWALAYYQWQSCRKFRDIFAVVPPSHVCAMYMPYHEMDISQFIDRMEKLWRKANPDTRLKVLRTRAGISQSELAERSMIPLRTIQHYEQGTKDLRRAAGESLYALSTALGVSMEELL